MTKMLINKSALPADVQKKLNDDRRVQIVEDNHDKVIVEVNQSDIDIVKQLYHGLVDLSEG